LKRDLSIALLLLLFTFPSKAGNVITLTDTTSVFVITDRAMLFEDTSTRVTFDQILSSEYQAKFTASTSLAPNYNVTKSAIWLKFILTTQIRDLWKIDYSQPNIPVIEFYRIQNGNITRQNSGLSSEPTERVHTGHMAIFDLDISPGDTVTVYLRLVSIGPLKVKVNAGTAAAYLDHEQRENFIHGLYLGVLLLMILYNIFLFVTNYDRVYIYYVLYIALTGIFIFFFNGYILVFPEWLILAMHKIPVAVPLGFGFFGLLFTIRFLNTKHYSPFLHKLIVATIYTVPIPFIALVIGFPLFSVILVQLLGIVLSFLSIITGIQVLRKGYRPARYYVIGFGAYMLGLFFLITTDLFGITSAFLSQYALELGSAIEAVMLSFAIGDKLNIANKDRVVAQKNALEQSLENERLIREQNIFLEKKVLERTTEIQQQKEIIEEKQKEIVDSINYAKRIQYTLLANEEVLKTNLRQYSVMFRPKDIVSGDFYWCTSNENGFYLAVCDCTGHGVPGAFMSLLNISFLNEAINEKKISEPNEVFNFVRGRLVSNMEGGRDGMDAILLRFFDGSITYAAANNRPVLIQNGHYKELAADKMPVGSGIKSESFTLFQARTQSGDTLVCYTDGFADQFGGPKGKKFKYASLNQLLTETATLTPDLLNEKLQMVFDEWKGELEQVDDVCVIAIRI